MEPGEERADRIAQELQTIAEHTRVAWLPAWALFVLVLLALLWGESHDANCYARASLQVAGAVETTEEAPEDGCLILPWNDPR
jgi:hypothetical protein